MNEQEMGIVITFVKATCPAQKFEELTPDAWMAIFGDLAFADVCTALTGLGRQLRFIAPADIHGEVRRIRNGRLDKANIIYEPADGETAAEFCKRITAVLQAAADGDIEPTPVRLALAPVPSNGPPPELRDAIVRHQAQRGPLTIRCPHCEAGPGDRCSTRSRLRRAPSGGIHQARADAYAQATPAPELSPKDQMTIRQPRRNP